MYNYIKLMSCIAIYSVDSDHACSNVLCSYIYSVDSGHNNYYMYNYIDVLYSYI